MDSVTCLFIRSLLEERSDPRIGERGRDRLPHGNDGNFDNPLASVRIRRLPQKRIVAVANESRKAQVPQVWRAGVADRSAREA
jgi:hypothetical protein